MIQFTFFAISKSTLSLSLMLFLLALASAQLDNPHDFVDWSCGGKQINNGSDLERNLKMVSTSLVENVNKTGYYTSSYGEKGDAMYGLAQCRGDLNASTCRSCISLATDSLLEDCTGSSSVSIRLSGCFLIFNTDNFYSKLDRSGVGCTEANGYTKNWEQDPSITAILRKLMDDAVSSNVGFGTQNGSGIYSLAECRRDLSMNQCRQCLDMGFQMLPTCGNISNGGVYNQDFVIRYARHKFYGDAVLLPQPPSGSGPSKPLPKGSFLPTNGPSRAREGERHHNLPLMLGLTIAGFVIVMVLIGVIIIWKMKVTKPLSKKPPLPDDRNPHELLTAMSKSKLHYRYQALQTATNNFNPVNKIGQGGFGSVYKGILPNGTEIAVKRLLANREQSVSDFFNEVNLISNVQHKNLVKLLGFSVAGTERLLVYEYLPNKSLDHFLFDENLGRLQDWQRRFEIILGTAGGLTYLHQESDTRIIHRDIKASNILLDQHFKAKIADFGLVRYFAEDQTHLSTTIVGTRGYMAPEYLVHGHLTEKVDVYAFGVLVLEIISGRKNKTPMHVNDTPSLLTKVWNNYLSGTLSNVIDPNIQENYEELQQVVHVALLCTQVSARLRPSMSKVIVFLTTKNPSLPAPTQPPYIDVDSSKSNTNTSVVPEPETYNSVSNVALPPATPMSLNTISTSSFGPR